VWLIFIQNSKKIRTMAVDKSMEEKKWPLEILPMFILARGYRAWYFNLKRSVVRQLFLGPRKKRENHAIKRGGEGKKTVTTRGSDPASTSGTAKTVNEWDRIVKKMGIFWGIEPEKPGDLVRKTWDPMKKWDYQVWLVISKSSRSSFNKVKSLLVYSIPKCSTMMFSDNRGGFVLTFRNQTSWICRSAARALGPGKGELRRKDKKACAQKGFSKGSRSKQLH